MKLWLQPMVFDQRCPTKVKHQAGSTVKINPHVLPFAHCCFHNSALQCCLKLDRLDPNNDLCKFEYASAATQAVCITKASLLSSSATCAARIRLPVQ